MEEFDPSKPFEKVDSPSSEEMEFDSSKPFSKVDDALPIESSVLSALWRGPAQYASAGWADEIGAGIESLLTGKPYEQAVAESRAAFDAAKEQHPYIYHGAGLPAGIAAAVATPSLYGAKALQGAGLLTKLGAGIAEGAGMSVLNTAGELEDASVSSLGELKDKYGASAVLGGGGVAIAPLAAGAAKVVGKTGKGVLDAILSSETLEDIGTAYTLGKTRDATFGKPAQQALGDSVVTQAKIINRYIPETKDASNEILTLLLEGKKVSSAPIKELRDQIAEKLKNTKIEGVTKRHLEGQLDALDTLLKGENKVTKIVTAPSPDSIAHNKALKTLQALRDKNIKYSATQPKNIEYMPLPSGGEAIRSGESVRNVGQPNTGEAVTAAKVSREYLAEILSEAEQQKIIDLAAGGDRIRLIKQPSGDYAGVNTQTGNVEGIVSEEYAKKLGTIKEDGSFVINPDATMLPTKPITSVIEERVGGHVDEQGNIDAQKLQDFGQIFSNKFGASSDFVKQNPEVTWDTSVDLAHAVKTKISDQMKELDPEVDKIMSTLHNFHLAKGEGLPRVTSRDILNYTKAGTSASEAQSKINLYLKLVKDPKDLENLKKSIETVSKKARSIEKANMQGLESGIIPTLIGSAKALPVNLANIAGRTIREIEDVSPPELLKLGGQVSSLGSKAAQRVGKALSAMAEETPQRRRALLFVLKQIPENRDVLKEAGIEE